MYTRQQWATDLLHAIGNTNPMQSVVDWVVSWTKLETKTGGGASYNLLNTTQLMPGSTSFNNLGGGVGVQNYPTYSEGIAANAKVLMNGTYQGLLTALQQNDINSLGFGGGQSVSPGVQSGLNRWCSNCYTGQDIINNISASSLSDTFNGSSQSVPGVQTSNIPTVTLSTGSSSQSSPTACAPWDIPCMMLQLVHTDWFIRATIVVVGLAVAIIGIFVLFVGHGAEVKS